MTIVSFGENNKIFDNRSGVYAIVNIKNGKFYVGSAMKLTNRKRIHLSNLRNKKHGNVHLQRSYDKHGEENFIFKVLEYVENKKLLEEIEDIWIEKYKSTGILYNIREKASSNLGIKYSEESKRRISESQKKPVVQLDKDNNVISRFDSMIDAENQTKIYRVNISHCCLGKIKTAGGFLWMYEKEYLNGKRYNENYLIWKGSKAVLQFTKNNEFIKKYNSIRDAGRQSGINNSHISWCCLGKLKSAGGFVWRFA